LLYDDVPGQIDLARFVTAFCCTPLYFGTTITPPPGAKPGQGLGPIFTALLRFHKLYSRALLAGARRKQA